MAHSTSTEIPRGFIWECGKKWWINYIAFLVVEVGVFAGLIAILRKRYLTSADILPLKISFVPLLLIPLVYLGFYNDFPAKAGIVPMFFLTITFARLICQIISSFLEKNTAFFNRKQLLPLVALFVWLASAIAPINIFLHPIFPHPLYNTNLSFQQLSVANPARNLSDLPLSSQFLGDLNSSFYSRLFKQSKAPNEPAKKAED